MPVFQDSEDVSSHWCACWCWFTFRVIHTAVWIHLREMLQEPNVLQHSSILLLPPQTWAMRKPLQTLTDVSLMEKTLRESRESHRFSLRISSAGESRRSKSSPSLSSSTSSCHTAAVMLDDMLFLTCSVLSPPAVLSLNTPQARLQLKEPAIHLPETRESHSYSSYIWPWCSTFIWRFKLSDSFLSSLRQKCFAMQSSSNIYDGPFPAIFQEWSNLQVNNLLRDDGVFQVMAAIYTAQKGDLCCACLVLCSWIPNWTCPWQQQTNTTASTHILCWVLHWTGKCKQNVKLVAPFTLEYHPGQMLQ